MSVSIAIEYFKTIDLTEKQQEISSSILKEIQARLQFMLDVGLHYLTLNRVAGSLSGGEAQRIRLASQIGSSLVGALYVLDEPTIGLHQRDNERLIETLEHLRDIGNTVLVVEHDEDTIRRSDYMIEIGPGAGKHGGHVVAAGTVPDIFKNKKSRRSCTVARIILARTKPSSALSTLIKRFSSTSLRSVALHDRTQQRTPAHGHQFANCLLQLRRRSFVATSRDALVSTFRVGDARTVKATARSKLKCISFRPSS